MESESSAVRSLNPKMIIGIVAAIGFGIIFIIVKVWLEGVFYKNPYGDEIAISNFDEYFKEVPNDYKERIFYNLYNMVKRNLPDEDTDELNKAVGEVRESSVERRFNSETNVHYDSFLVDLETVRQTYRVQFEWSTNKDNQYIVGADVILTCPKKSESAYDDFQCIDMFIEQKEIADRIYEEFPIIESLPIDIAYYERKTGRYISYRIAGALSEDEKEYTITITDRSGENYNLALERIREQWCGRSKCNPDDYKIKYMDVSLDGDPEVKF